MIKKKIVWITPDCFYDVDYPIVNRLVLYYDIRWFVIWTKGACRDHPKNSNIYQLINIPYRGRDLRNIVIYYKIIKNIVAINPEVVYNGYDGDPYFYPMAFCMFDRKKYIMEGHETNPYRRGVHNLFVVKCLTWDINHMGHVQVFSKFAETEFRKMYPNTECTYIPMVPKDFGPPTEKMDYNGRKIFLFFGSIRPNKRLDVLLKAFTTMDEIHLKKAQLLVYGKCNEINKEEYNSVICGYDNIEMHLGFADDGIIPKLFCSASYLVLPYQVVTQSGPNMIACNYNLPIIATNIAGFTERITHKEDGYIFPVNDIDALRNTLQFCIDQPEEDYRRIQNNMKKRVEKEYSSTVIIEQYKKMINYVIEKNSKIQ